MEIQTRVRHAEVSNIVKISKGKRQEILRNSKKNKGGYGVSQMVRELQVDDGFFVMCENQDRKFSHVYTVAKEAGIPVTVVAGQDENGKKGFWILEATNI
jgi:hypothetical protein